MKRTSYEKQVNEIKDIIVIKGLDIFDTNSILCYLSGYTPETPIGVLMDAIFSLRDEYWTRF